MLLQTFSLVLFSVQVSGYVRRHPLAAYGLGLALDWCDSLADSATDFDKDHFPKYKITSHYKKNRELVKLNYYL